MRKFQLSLFAVAIILCSCNLFGKRVNGNGHIISQEKSVGSFRKVEVSGSIKVHVRQGMGNAVKIETDENLFEFLDIHTDGSTLVIRTRNGYNLDPSRDVIAWVTAPTYEDIDVSGACDIIGDGEISGNEALSMHVSGSGEIRMQVNLPKVSTEISGNGSVNLKGQATDFDGEISGSGSINCFDLVTDNASIDLSGSANAQITANKQLKVEVSGSADVQYKGSASVNQSISGSGSVRKVG